MNNGRADRGWTWLVNSDRWHYFEECRSLCGRWAYFGGDYFPFMEVPGGLECRACRREQVRKAVA